MKLIITHNIKRLGINNNTVNTKVSTDGQTRGRLKRIELVGFGNLVSLTFFQSSILLFVTFDIMLEM